MSSVICVEPQETKYEENNVKAKKRKLKGNKNGVKIKKVQNAVNNCSKLENDTETLLKSDEYDYKFNVQLEQKSELLNSKEDVSRNSIKIFLQSQTQEVSEIEILDQNKSKLSISTSDDDFEVVNVNKKPRNNKKESTGEDSPSASIKEEKKVKRQKRKNSINSNVIKALHSEINVTTECKKQLNEDLKQKVNGILINTSNSNLLDNETGHDDKLKQKVNAFTFMMNQRHKSIGENSPGKEIEQVEEPPEIKLQYKKKLQARKTTFEEWSNRKGAKEKQAIYKEKGIIIEKKLEKRAKRLKKMLTTNNSICDSTKRKSKHVSNDSDVQCGEFKDQCVESNDQIEDEKIIELSRPACFSNKKDVQMVLTSQNTPKWKMKVKIQINDDQASQDWLASKLNNETKQAILFSGSSSDSDEPLASKKYCDTNKKNTKFASIFTVDRSKKKLKVSKAVLEARKQFLHSPLPEAERKAFEKHHSVEEENYQVFPLISHILVKPTPNEQAESSLNFWNLPKVNLQLKAIQSYTPNIGSLQLGCVTLSDKQHTEPIKEESNLKQVGFKKLLRQIKSDNPDYPVIRTFKCLNKKNKKGAAEVIINKTNTKAKTKKINFDDSVEVVEATSGDKQEAKQLWTDLYKPSSSEEIYGNKFCVDQIKTWLNKWIKLVEETNAGRKKRKRYDSDTSSDFEFGDMSGRDNCQLSERALILYGPNGCGKTMTVYALCNQLGINVLEINASSKRTGKRLLQELQEATRSHQVRKTDTVVGFVKDSNSQEDDDNLNSSRRICLLLVEDVDIVFEQDENFLGALNQLLTTSKRPIILTTTDCDCLHLRKFTSLYPLLTFSALTGPVLAPWLQVLCLIEGSYVDRHIISRLLEQNRGDVRSTLLELQFWIQRNSDDAGNILKVTLNTDYSQGLQSNSLMQSASSNLGEIWWNTDISVYNNFKDSKDLKNYSNACEALASTDLLYRKLDINTDLEPVHNQHRNLVKDSLELNESLEYFNFNKEFGFEWSRELLDARIPLLKDQNEDLRDGIKKRKLWRTKQLKCCEALQENLSIVHQLESKALSLDYLPTLRTICRSELIRASNNTKRRNRFYHYLRGLGVRDSDSIFETMKNAFHLDV